jgi:hypothetical protein
MGGLGGIGGVGWKYKNPMDRMLKGASAKVTLQPGENCYKAGQMWGLDMDILNMSVYAAQV